MNYLKVKLFVFVSLSVMLWAAAGNAADEPQDTAAAQTPKIEIKLADTETIRWFLPYEKPFRMTGF